MSFTVRPASRSVRAVPPVEINSTPAAARVCPKAANPVLSETESKALWILAIAAPQSAEAATRVNRQKRLAAIAAHRWALASARLRHRPRHDQTNWTDPRLAVWFLIGRCNMVRPFF